MENKNTLRTPWTVERNSRYRGLFNVYDCDGNAIVKEIKGVALLIAAAPSTKKQLDELLSLLAAKEGHQAGEPVKGGK
jgi:hypothetical protein